MISHTKILKDSKAAVASQSPQRKPAPEISQRSSSLTESSTPIETRKKKARKFIPVEEEIGRAIGQTNADETGLVR